MRARRPWLAYATIGALVVLAGTALATSHVPFARTTLTSGTATTRDVQLNGQTVRVMLADTAALRKKGLSGRDNLAPGEGMLFIFPENGVYGFWMKNMRFPLDILWLSDTGAVVYMVESVSPETYPENFTPDKPARYVLELPSGWAKVHGVQLGDIVRL